MEASSPVTTAVLVAPTLLVGASLVAVAVSVVVEVVVLATAEILGAVGDEVVQITAVVAPGVLLPLPVVVDALKLRRLASPAAHLKQKAKRQEKNQEQS